MKMLHRRHALGLASNFSVKPPADSLVHDGLGTSAQSPVDTAKHTVQMIDVAPGVAVEVLDYGGEGPPVIFLAGLGLTAHVYDDFAPRLTDRNRVYAMTRRGFGASSEPDSGYDIATRVADDIAVLDALGYERAVWIGHSMAGDELNGLGVSQSARVSKLVYLDATSDHGEDLSQLISSLPPGPKFEPPPADAWDDPVKLLPWLEERMGSKLPLSELLAELKLSADHPPQRRAYANADADMIAASPPLDFSDIGVPALVMVAPPDGPQGEPGWDTMTPDQQEAWRKAWPKVEAFVLASYNNVLKNFAGVKFLALPDSDHFMFIRSADEVFAQIRRFIAAE